jgi:hypothetical protein
VVRDEKEKDRWYLQLERYNMTANDTTLYIRRSQGFSFWTGVNRVALAPWNFIYSEEPRFLIFDRREQSSVALAPWKTLVDMVRDMG